MNETTLKGPATTQQRPTRCAQRRSTATKAAEDGHCWPLHPIDLRRQPRPTVAELVRIEEIEWIVRVSLLLDWGPPGDHTSCIQQDKPHVTAHSPSSPRCHRAFPCKGLITEWVCRTGVVVVQEYQRCGGDRTDAPGLRLTLRSARKVIFSSELPRSPMARNPLWPC